MGVIFSILNNLGRLLSKVAVGHRISLIVWQTEILVELTLLCAISFCY